MAIRTLCLFLFIGSAFVAHASDPLLNKQLQMIIDKARIEYELPALSMSIKLPGEKGSRNFTSGYYSLSKKKKITANTLFQIGSITKTFTATIVLDLVQKHTLNLDDRIKKYLPQYPRWHVITIKNLLNHTSGIYNYTHGDYFDNQLRKMPSKHWSLSELANIAYQHADLFKPGQKYAYTNTDYILLGLIIEKITHQSIEQVFKHYLSEHRLKNIFYSAEKYPDNMTNQIAHGYNRDGTFSFNQDVTFVSQSFSQCAGAMIATPKDLISWLEQLFDLKIINSKALATMMAIISETDAKPLNLQKIKPTPASSNKEQFTEIGTGLGLGLLYFKNFGLTWAHAGGMPGYESFYAYNPCKGIYLVLMYNVKPKKQLVFIQIANEIFKVLNHSKEVNDYIKSFRFNHTLPLYCQSSC